MVDSSRTTVILSERSELQDVVILSVVVLFVVVLSAVGAFLRIINYI